jgi:hypothetical protein
MERGPSWEANSYWSSQDSPRILWKLEDPLPCSQEPTTSLYPEPDESTPYPHTIYQIRINNILQSKYRSS